MSDASITAVFAARMRAARKALGISQAELGVRMGLSEDVASTRINRYEKDKSPPSVQTMREIAAVLGLPLAALIVESERIAKANILLALMSDEDQEAQVASMLRKVDKRKAEKACAVLQTATPPAKNKETKRRTP